MRVLVGLLAVSSALGQVDLSRLHALYGEPVREMFAATPDVRVVVSYAASRNANSLEITPAKQDSFIPDDVLDRILDQMIPPSMRGVMGQYGELVMSRVSNRSTDYENVSISRLMTASQVTRAIVLLKPSFGDRNALFFRALYGQPIAEGFSPRTDVGMTVSHSPGRMPCALEIRPVSDAPFVPDDVLDGLLEEAVPVSTRGAKLDDLYTINGHAGQNFTEYAFVSITRLIHMPGLVHTKLLGGATALVQYKTQECEAGEPLK
ncbi:MAG TPA: hypothetical protein VKU01_30835 [Bryobacteraceae bacterium]|nr:hypothetical protein [Bryobacteraceae bacterium]